jgi:hypothetical protein
MFRLREIGQKIISQAGPRPYIRDQRFEFPGASVSEPILIEVTTEAIEALAVQYPGRRVDGERGASCVACQRVDRCPGVRIASRHFDLDARPSHRKGTDPQVGAVCRAEMLGEIANRRAKDSRPAEWSRKSRCGTYERMSPFAGVKEAIAERVAMRAPGMSGRCRVGIRLAGPRVGCRRPPAGMSARLRCVSISYFPHALNV